MTDVDYYLPGCPPQAPQIWAVVEAILGGNLPPKGSVVGASQTKTVCDECRHNREEKRIKKFYRPHEIIPDHDACLFDQGIICPGPAGMAAALSLADMGHEVDLVERSQQLGGNLWRVRTLVDWETAELADKQTQQSATKAGGLPVNVPTSLVWRDPLAFLQQLVEQVESHQRIHLHKGARVKAISGWAGQFETTLGPFRRAEEADEQWEETLQHGAVVVATGGRAVRPDEYH